MDLRDHIRTIPDFPKPGILFYDISTLIRNAGAWRYCIDQLMTEVRPHSPDMLLGIESRGFLPASALSLELGIGFTMVRKPGKLPGETIAHSYDLEYGSDEVHIQADALHAGQRVVILDDLLATGGTLRAAIELARKADADVQAAVCIIELDGLGGRDMIDVPLTTLIEFPA